VILSWYLMLFLFAFVGTWELLNDPGPQVFLFAAGCLFCILIILHEVGKGKTWKIKNQARKN